MRKLFVVLVVGAVLVVAALVSRPASAQGPTVGTTDATAQTGAQGTAQLYAHDFSAPGLGAWTINIAYDTDVITVTGCTPVEGSGACNPRYSEGVVRSAGADAFGLEGDSILVEIQFTCADDEGGTTLEVRPRDVSDATVGGPQLLAVDVSNGMVSCQAAGVVASPTPRPMPLVPDAGGGPGPGAPDWARVAAALLGVLVAGLVAFGAGARAFPRRAD